MFLTMKDTQFSQDISAAAHRSLLIAEYDPVIERKLFGFDLAEDLYHDRGFCQRLPSGRPVPVDHLSVSAAAMILDSHGFFKQATKFNRTQIDILDSMINLLQADIETGTSG